MKTFYKNSFVKFTFKICHFAVIIVLISIASCKGYEKDMPPPNINFYKLADSLVEARIGDTIYLIPKITYDYNSNYKWYINNEESGNERDIMHVSEKLGEVLYSFTVTTPNGKDSVSLIIRTIELIDFNDFILNDNSYNIGEYLQEGEEGFIFNSLLLPNRMLPEKKWEGFAMSYMYNVDSYPNDTIYSVYGTVKTNRVFTILSLSDSQEFNTFNFKKDSSYLVGSIDVCNSTRVYNTIFYGIKDFIPPFKRKIEGYEGDSLFLRFNGYDNQDIYTGKVDFFLADYRFEKNSDVILIKNFTPVDLTPLGKVNKIVVEMFSSLNDYSGNMLTPPFVCFDNIKIFDKVENK